MGEQTNVSAAPKTELPEIILFDLGGVLVQWDAIDPLIALWAALVRPIIFQTESVGTGSGIPPGTTKEMGGIA